MSGIVGTPRVTIPVEDTFGRVHDCISWAIRRSTLLAVRDGAEDDGGVAGDAPAVVALERRGAAAAVAGVLAVPEDLPPLPLGRGHQGLGGRVGEQVAAEV